MKRRLFRCSYFFFPFFREGGGSFCSFKIYVNINCVYVCCYRELHSAMGEQDNVLHRQCVRSSHLDELYTEKLSVSFVLHWFS